MLSDCGFGSFILSIVFVLVFLEGLEKGRFMFVSVGRAAFVLHLGSAVIPSILSEFFVAIGDAHLGRGIPGYGIGFDKVQTGNNCVLVYVGG